MAEPEDLLSKADALMARHRPARTGAEPYAELPLLDEVVDRAQESDDLPLLTELVEPDAIAPDRVAAGPLHPEQSAALAASMRASLLAALQPQIDSLIEKRLKESLEPLVEKLFYDLRGELQLIARDTLSDAITLAVEREIKRRESGD
jgi:hypothetical protein